MQKSKRYLEEKKTKSTSNLFIKKNIAGCGKGFLSGLNAYALKSSCSLKAPSRKFKTEVREKTPEKISFLLQEFKQMKFAISTH